MDKCKKCGTSFEENDKFCSSCGTKREYEETVVKEKTFSDLEKGIEKVEFTRKEVDKSKENTGKIDIPKKKEESSNRYFEDDYGSYNAKDERTYREDSKIGKNFHIIIILLFAFGFIGGYFFFTKNHTTSSSSAEVNSKQIVNYNNSNNTKDNAKNDKAQNYILPNSNKKPLTANDLKNMNKEKLSLARNEIFARHGYVFDGEPYKSYFNSKPWYKPDSKFTGEGKELSPLERHNIKIIMKAEGLEKNLAPNYDADYDEANYSD